MGMEGSDKANSSSTAAFTAASQTHTRTNTASRAHHTHQWATPCLHRQQRKPPAPRWLHNRHHIACLQHPLADRPGSCCWVGQPRSPRHPHAPAPNPQLLLPLHAAAAAAEQPALQRAGGGCTSCANIDRSSRPAAPSALAAAVPSKKARHPPKPQPPDRHLRQRQPSSRQPPVRALQQSVQRREKCGVAAGDQYEVYRADGCLARDLSGLAGEGGRGLLVEGCGERGRQQLVAGGTRQDGDDLAGEGAHSPVLVWFEVTWCEGWCWVSVVC